MVTRFGYLDWLRTSRGSGPDTHPPRPVELSHHSLKQDLVRFVADFSRTDHAHSMVEVNAGAVQPVLYWLRNKGRCGIAIKEGIISVVLHKPPAGRWLREQADNVAMIVAHMLRRSLGDEVIADEPHSGSGGSVYVVGPLELEPLPVELDKPGNGDVAAEAFELLSKDVLPHLLVRDKEAPNWPVATRNALANLCARPVAKRDYIFSAMTKLKWSVLQQPTALRAHARLPLTIAALGGIFFGSVFSETLLSSTIARTSREWWPLWLASFFVWSIVFWLASTAAPIEARGKPRAGRSSVRRRQRKGLWVNGWSAPMALMTLVAAFLVGALVAANADNGAFTKASALALGVVLFSVSVVIFLLAASHENRVQKILDLESLDPLDDQKADRLKRQQRLLEVFLTLTMWIGPVLLLLPFVVPSILKWTVHGFDAFPDWPKEIAGWLKDIPGWLQEIYDQTFARDLDRAYYGDVLRTVAWALPIIALGLLISTWNRFGQSGAATMVHEVILRRLKEVQGLIKAHSALPEMLKTRYKELNFIDLGRSADAVAPRADIVIEHQQAVRAGLLRQTAMVAAGVLALLQFDAFKRLEPSPYFPPDQQMARAFRDMLIDQPPGPLVDASVVPQRQTIESVVTRGKSAPCSLGFNGSETLRVRDTRIGDCMREGLRKILSRWKDEPSTREITPIMPLPSIELNVSLFAARTNARISGSDWTILLDEIDKRLARIVSTGNASVFMDAPEQCGGSSGGRRLVAKLYYPLNRFRIEDVTCSVLYDGEGNPEEKRRRRGARSVPEECTASPERDIGALPERLRRWTKQRLMASSDTSVLALAFTDSNGTPSRNMTLAESRARHVWEVLSDSSSRLDLGTKNNRVPTHIQSRGEEATATFFRRGRNADPSLSRRVEIRLCGKADD
jgi:hypothetical protein